MNVFGIAITYAVSWWMVLFMVLPFGVQTAATPGAGHAPSAPVKPRLRRKFLITTLLTIIPTAAIYLAAVEAKAAEADIYRTQNAGPDIYRTKDAGGGVYQTKHAGEECKSATLPNTAGDMPVDVNVPIAPYYDASHQGSFGNTSGAANQGAIGLGKAQINSDGSMSVNSKQLGGANVTGDCPPSGDTGKAN